MGVGGLRVQEERGLGVVDALLPTARRSPFGRGAGVRPPRGFEVRRDERVEVTVLQALATGEGARKVADDDVFEHTQQASVRVCARIE